MFVSGAIGQNTPCTALRYHALTRCPRWNGPHPYRYRSREKTSSFTLQANTIRHRRVLSLFQLGTLILSASDPPKISQLDIKNALHALKHNEIIQ